MPEGSIKVIKMNRNPLNIEQKGNIVNIEFTSFRKQKYNFKKKSNGFQTSVLCYTTI